MLAFLVTQKEGDTSMSNSDGSGGRELRLVLAVNDFEHFLSASKGLSVSTRECYVRHVLAFLTDERERGAQAASAPAAEGGW
jgi:hypothetical protein